MPADDTSLKNSFIKAAIPSAIADEIVAKIPTLGNVTEMTTGQETIVCIGASTVARTNCLAGIDMHSVVLTNGKISFNTSGNNLTARVGDLIRIESLNNQDVEGTYKVLSVASISGPAYAITAQVQNGLLPANKTLGQCVSTGFFTHLQHWSSAAAWPSHLQLAMAGKVRCVTVGVSGASISDYINSTERMANATQYGQVGAFIIDLLGNTVKSGAQSAIQVIADMVTLITLLRPYARVIYILQSPALTNENRANPDNTQVFVNSQAAACASRVNTMLDDLPKVFPMVKIIPIYAVEAVNYGNTSYYTNWSVDVANGYALYESKGDDGVHNQWDAAQRWGACIASYVALDFPFKATESLIKGNNVNSAPTSDVGGGYMMNLVEGSLFGTVSASGGIPSGYSATASNIAGYTVSNQVSLNADGGSDWISTAVSNGNLAGQNTATSQIYTGVSNSLKTWLNNPRYQGVDIDIWWHCGVYGFTDQTMTAIEVVLEGDVGDGQNFVPIASGFSAMGNFQASSMQYLDSTRGRMTSGFWGIVRFPRFQILPGTVYTAVQIRQSAKPRNGFDPGTYYMRMGSGSVIKPLI